MYRNGNGNWLHVRFAEFFLYVRRNGCFFMKVKFEDQVPSYSFPTSPFAAYSKPSPNVNCSAHNYNSRQNMGVAKGKGANKSLAFDFQTSSS